LRPAGHGGGKTGRVKGFGPFPGGKGTFLPHVNVCVSCMAKFHARFAGHTRLLKLPSFLLSHRFDAKYCGKSSRAALGCFFVPQWQIKLTGRDRARDQFVIFFSVSTMDVNGRGWFSKYGFAGRTRTTAFGLRRLESPASNQIIPSALYA